MTFILQIMEVEADSFWCLTKVLDGIQDNYTFAQPGIQLKVKQLEELIQRVDKELHDHLVKHEVLYLQFAFRWMNNLVSSYLLPRHVPTTLMCTGVWRFETRFHCLQFGNSMTACRTTMVCLYI